MSLIFNITILVILLGVVHTTAKAIPAIGYSALTFNLANPGTYKLHYLGDAIDGQILNAKGKHTTLYQLYDDKVVILGFVYLNCSDVNGCPLTTFVVQQLKQEIEQVETLANNVRLVSLSFDPKHDTPKLLSHHGAHMGSNDNIWSLVTTKNEQMLQPLLEGYNQPIQKIYDDSGSETGKINHILRVFLIDKDKKIRNIYSTAFLHKDVLLNDIKTVILEQQPNISFSKTINRRPMSHHKNHGSHTHH